LILVLAGTKDGRALAASLAEAGFEVIASAATAYGGELLRDVPGIAVHAGVLDGAGLDQLLTEHGIKGILDATHPFAKEISRLACETASARRIPYLRWERPQEELPASDLLHRVADWEEAVSCLVRLGVSRVFLAVGVKALEFLLRHPSLSSCHFTVRVLPLPEAINSCTALGLRPEQICALQGPVTRELNQALLEYYHAGALVTKESGSTGGTAAKVAAALALEIPVVLVERPAVAAGLPAVSTVAEVLSWAAEIEL